MKELSSKVAVVTGAASGIGRAMALHFAEAGMKVVLADIEEGPLASVAAELQKAGAEAEAIRCDTSSAKDVEKVAELAFKRFGHVHVLCNNAGVSGSVKPIWELTEDDWQWVMGVNLWGVIHGIRAFVPQMVASGQPGHVVNTASIAGLLSFPMMAAYQATKHAVVSVSETLFHDLTMSGAPIGVSVVCPGWVQTKIAESARNRPRPQGEVVPPAETQPVAAQIGKLVQSGIAPEQVAAAIGEAIRENKFYVFTHPELLGSYKKRTDRILAATQPKFDGF